MFGTVLIGPVLAEFDTNLDNNLLLAKCIIDHIFPANSKKKSIKYI